MFKKDNLLLYHLFTSILTDAMEKRFGQQGWDLKTLKAKVNQKCRDSITKTVV